MQATITFSFSHNVFYHSRKPMSIFWFHLFCRLKIISIWTSLQICRLEELTLSQTSPDFYASAVQVFTKHYGERRNCSLISPFPTVFSTLLENCPPFSAIYIKFEIDACKLFQFRLVYKFVVSKTVKSGKTDPGPARVAQW